MIKFSQLPTVVNGKITQLHQDTDIRYLLTDSRKAIVHEGSLFFAISGIRHDGHNYIRALYETGIRQFVVEYDYPLQNFPQANFIVVESATEALQAVAGHHRRQFSIPVIGVTGSNGKTIIKEWLYQLLGSRFDIVKNPGSYNSQIGVPLSVWQMQSHHDLGIFEAGISLPGEMEKLERVIQPTLGVFSTIGSAHDEGFSGRDQKISEKLKLFRNSEAIVYCKDHSTIDDAIRKENLPGFTWSYFHDADIIIQKGNDSYRIKYKKLDFKITLPFTGNASVENALHCIAVMLYLNFKPEEIASRVRSLLSVSMRLELKEGIHQTQLIDDSYNNDLAGLQIALDFLSSQQQRKHKTLILSDIEQTGLSEKELLQRIADLINASGVEKFIGIGKALINGKNVFPESSIFFKDTEDFLDAFDPVQYQDQLILVKGARSFGFERIITRLQRKVHGTVMEIDLGGLVHNLNFFKSKLKDGVKLMVMVKAFAYGSGSIEIANVLQYHHVDYLGVAYADEGVELRRNNIVLPIMVMNPSAESFGTILAYNLEPEIFSLKILKELIAFLEGRNCKIHLKIDTGMHRLGFDDKDVEDLISILKSNPNLEVQSVFSHLAGSDESIHDEFSKEQSRNFTKMADRISSEIHIKPILHILNTPGILRFPELQFDMVRLGIGLYGIDPTENKSALKSVATLKTVVSQVRELKKGETIGYGRRGVADKDIRIATIAIGYADGFSRAFSRGVGEVLVRGKRAPVIGNVCMDMTMIDVTGLNVEDGDEVIIFGRDLPIETLAQKINTIPYEVLTSTSERVKRVFVAESI